MKNFINLCLLVSALLLASCQSDPCKDVICGTSGTCAEGTCTCDAGYEMDSDGKCNVAMRDKFVGNYNLSETCGSGNDQYSVSIAASSQGIMKINITGLYNTSRTIVATLTNGQNFTIADNTPLGTGTIKGTGVHNPTTNKVTLSYTFTDANGNADACTATLTRL